MKKVLAYVRVSTMDQELSPDAQKFKCRQWFEEHKEEHAPCEYVGELEDIGVTSKIGLFQRPQGQHILTELGPGDLLIVAKLFRAFRGTVDAVESIRVLREAKIDFICLDLNIDSTTPVGKFMFTVFSAVGELERDLIRERTMEALQQTVKNGTWLGPPPLGYILIKRKQVEEECRRNLVPMPKKRNRLQSDRQFQQIILHAALIYTAGTPWMDVENYVRKAQFKNFFQKLNENTLTRAMARCALGWPQTKDAQIIEALGESPFTKAWVMQNFRKFHSARKEIL